MGFSFRVPLVLLSGGIRTDEEQFELDRDGDTQVWLQGTLSKPGRVTLRGSGFADAEAADAAARDWIAVLAAAFLRIYIDADFLERTDVGGGLSANVIEGATVRPDAPGVAVFRDEETVMFSGGHAVAHTLTDPRNLLDAVRQCSTIQANDDAVLAFDLLSARSMMPTPDAQLLTLVMALEVLVSPARLDEDAQALVSKLQADVDYSEVSTPTKASFRKRLEYFRSETIGRAGRNLADSLGGERFMEKYSAAEFFDHCYQLRSDLVHGNERPSVEQIREVLPELMRLTRALIAARFSQYSYS